MQYKCNADKTYKKIYTYIGDCMKYIDRIIALREDNDLKQKSLAKVLGRSQQGYSNLETGRVKFTVEEIMKLCAFYNVSADYILGFTDEITELPKNK